MAELSLPISNPIVFFALIVLLLLTAPLLFTRFRLPGLIGLVFAGVLLGPYAFGVLDLNPVMDLLSNIGLVFLLFLAGLETDLDHLSRRRSHSVAFGLLAFAIPGILAAIVFIFVLRVEVRTGVLISVIAAAQTLFSYPIVSRLGIAKNRAATTAVGGTFVTTLLALLFLTIVSGVVRGEMNLLFWIRFGAFSAALAFLVLFLVPRFGRWFFRRISDPTAEFLFVLATVFLSASISLFAGLEPLLGAFLAGLALNRLVPDKSILMNRLQFVGNSLFIPIFFLSVGMTMDFRVFGMGIDVWKIALTLTGIAIVGKFTAAKVTQKILGFTKHEGNLMAGLSVNHVTIALAAGVVGVRIGLFDHTVLSAVIFLIIVTSITGLLVTQRAARKVALGDDQKPLEPSVHPLQRALLPFARREIGERLVDLALALRPGASSEPIHPMMIVDDGSDVEERVAACEQDLSRIIVKPISSGLPVVPVTRVDSSPVVAILRALKEMRISILLLGWNDEWTSGSKGISGWFLETVLAQSSQTVLAARLLHPLPFYNRIVAAFPPLIERQEGLRTVVSALRLLGRQTGAKTVLTGTSDTLSRIRTIYEENRPFPPYAQRSLAAWKELLPALRKETYETDLVVLFAVRVGKLSWQPSLEKLPQQFDKELPGSSFAVLYLPDEAALEEATVMEPDGSAAIPETFRNAVSDFALDGVSMQSAVIRLLESGGISGEALKELATLLTNAGKEEPVELSPGVILLHTHTEHVEETLIAVGVNRPGFALSNGKKAQILFLLLNPVGLGPELHLRTLAEIARLVRSADKIEAFMNARKLADVFGVRSGEEGGRAAGHSEPVVT